MKKIDIHFNVPAIVGKERDYIEEVLLSKKLSGDGKFNKKCTELLQKRLNAKKVLLTTSCTHALDMAAILLDLKEGDEVIMPSYTFTSTATSVCLRGAKPVFVDIRDDTLNLDEEKIEKAITSRTKAIFVVHYAGIACEMDKIKKIADMHKLFIVEDAAQAIGSRFKGNYLGTLGHLGALSFHETKNCVCGEGGALIVNDERFVERAEIIREKGTDREKFFRGEIDKYSWVDLGSSYLPSELVAAYLYAQLENMDKINEKRKQIYLNYYCALQSLENKGKVRLPAIPGECTPNYHMFYLLLPNQDLRDKLMEHLKSNGILAIFHYIPLHLSLMGRKQGYDKGDLPVTEDLSGRILRLPSYYDLTAAQQDIIIGKIKEFFK